MACCRPSSRINDHLDDNCDSLLSAQQSTSLKTRSSANLPGLRLFHDFVSEPDEQQMLQFVLTHPSLQPSRVNGSHLYVDFGIGAFWRLNKASTKCTKLPAIFRALCAKIDSLLSVAVNQISCIVYEKGAHERCAIKN